MSARSDITPTEIPAITAISWEGDIVFRFAAFFTVINSLGRGVVK